MFRLCLRLSLLRLHFFFQKSLKEEQRECIRTMVCPKKEIIAVLPTGFGNSDIYGTKILEKMHRSSSTDSKTFVVVVSPLEHIRKQQVVNPKKNRIEGSLVLPHSGNQPSLTEKFDIVYGSAEQSEQWFSDTLLTK